MRTSKRWRLFRKLSRELNLPLNYHQIIYRTKYDNDNRRMVCGSQMTTANKIALRKLLKMIYKDDFIDVLGTNNFDYFVINLIERWNKDIDLVPVIDVNEFKKELIIDRL